MRWWFALKNGWTHRHLLKTFLDAPKKQIEKLQEITSEKLDENSVAVLVLDFDGVLAPHGDPMPLPENEAWLKSLCHTIGEQRIAIFSNKPNLIRRKYFAQQFPMVLFLEGVRKKPYPDGLGIIAEYKGVSLHRIALVDDRLLTGMLATILAYAQGYYFIKPFRNFWRRPIRETFFSFLRLLERMLIRIFG
jgi:predicted HAD superfamily phosphohydrolase YqeG